MILTSYWISRTLSQAEVDMSRAFKHVVRQVERSSKSTIFVARQTNFGVRHNFHVASEVTLHHKAWFPLSQLRPRQRPVSSQNKVISLKDDCSTL